MGVLDGDGCVGVDSKKAPYISFVTASPFFVEWVKFQLDLLSNKAEQKREYTRKIHKDGNCYRIKLACMPAAVVIDYFQKFPLPYLKRKWQKPEVLSYITEMKSKYPTKFLIHEQFPVEKS